jgi:hypothetical protein
MMEGSAVRSSKIKCPVKERGNEGEAHNVYNGMR